MPEFMYPPYVQSDGTIMRHYVCDTIAERDSLGAIPTGCTVFVKQTDQFYIRLGSQTWASPGGGGGSEPHPDVTAHQAMGLMGAHDHAHSHSDAVPPGVIVMWSGALAGIPVGWSLCDGTNGTPNLQDRFILGWTNGQNPGGTGGASTHSHSDHTGVINHTHPVTDPGHAHIEQTNSATNGGLSGWGARDTSTNTPSPTSYSTQSATTGVSISNPAGGVSALAHSDGTHIPPYFKLAFIMKNGEAPPVQPTGAFARREVTDSTPWQAGDGALSNIATVMFRWDSYETAEGVYDATTENALIAALEDAHAKGYKIVLRVFAGADIPSWASGGTHPVQFITTKANDSGGGVTEGDLIQVPLAWDANYRWHYQRLLTRLAGILDANDSGGHARHNHILYVPASMPTELGTEMTLGYGSVDPNFNRAAWNGVSTETQRRAWYTQAWKDCLDDHAALLPNVRRGLAGGHLFNDGWVGADDVIQAKGGPGVVCMTTSLKDNYITAHPNDHDYMLKGKAIGCFMGIQTAGESALTQGQGFVNACEFALANYDIHFLETYTNAFTSSTVRNLTATGGWPGGSVTTKQYLVDHASDLQSRLIT